MKSKLTKEWLVFYTKSRYEKKVNQELIEKGVHSYLPLIKVKKKWSDRYQLVEEPLFKSYIFAFIDESDRLKVISTKGIVNSVNFNGRIAVIPEFQIEYIKRLVEFKNDQLLVAPILEKGEKVRVVTGPLEGMEGIVEQRSDGKYVVFNIETINKSIKVKLSIDDVIKVIDDSSEAKGKK